MGRINKMKDTLREESMGSAGKNPLQIVKNEMKKKEFSEEEMDKLKEMMKEMDMDEESDMEAFEKACQEAKDFDGMKKAIEKYMK